MILSNCTELESSYVAMFMLSTLTAGPRHVLKSYIVGSLEPSLSNMPELRKELTSILSNLNDFQSLEVVDRVSETQLQVGENSN